MFLLIQVKLWTNAGSRTPYRCILFVRHPTWAKQSLAPILMHVSNVGNICRVSSYLQCLLVSYFIIIWNIKNRIDRKLKLKKARVMLSSEMVMEMDKNTDGSKYLWCWKTFNITREVFTLHSIHKKLYTMLRIFEEEIETS